MGNLSGRPKETTQAKIFHPTLLTRKEKKIIAKIWKQLGSNQQAFLRNVWLASADRSPRVKQILCLDDKGQDSERFKRLNENVRDFFDHLIVDCKLESDSVLQESFRMGFRHSEVTHNDFQPVFWDIFLVSLVESMEGQQELFGTWTQSKRAFAINSWHKLVVLVIHEMTHGYRADKIGIRKEMELV